MNVDTGNPASNSTRREYNAASATITHPREPPPPYSVSDTGVVNQQPIIHQTIIVQAPLKDTPMFYNCPKCDERVFTKVEYVSSKNTHMLAGFICGLTLWCMLCCLAAIPYYVSTFKKVQHYCPNCNTLLGTY
ncbi:LPS-induced TNF-alpha factor [Operophtera brumata]|uniref:LPS-induced TNF-alpha factor n=1 Tax=Operophtera brumata TaxID=104452 RepID=A0A0L7LPV5_OPEBR|nr:LPS-induced TNF-alpha factor [Operophtera brumata]